MTRKKERQKIIHTPSVKEIFVCLGNMPIYSRVLLQNSSKPYNEFLTWVLNVNFFRSDEDRIVIKKIASEFGSNSDKVTKWIKEIYEDIFELNDAQPTLFQSDEQIPVSLYFKHFDNFSMFNTSLLALPREFESFNFYFMQAKMGIRSFWVSKIEHQIDEEKPTITIWLEGGFANKYREFALDKALFQGWIGLMETYDTPSFELDNKLRKIYRD